MQKRSNPLITYPPNDPTHHIILIKKETLANITTSSHFHVHFFIISISEFTFSSTSFHIIIIEFPPSSISSCLPYAWRCLAPSIFVQFMPLVDLTRHAYVCRHPCAGLCRLLASLISSLIL